VSADLSHSQILGRFLAENQMRQMLLNRSAFCSKILDDGQDALRVAGLPE
jgi:hypothetical protein